jgi:hypothetical protein
MLARTRTTCIPTRLGKEIGVFVERLEKANAFIVQYPFCSQIWWSNRKLQCTP